MFVIIICQSIMAVRIFAIYERERRMGYLSVLSPLRRAMQVSNAKLRSSLGILVALEAIGCIAASTRIVRESSGTKQFASC